jgi:hypothetical protein
VRRVRLLACFFVIAGVVTSACNDAGANTEGSITTLAGKRIPGTSPVNWRPFKVCHKHCDVAAGTELYSQGRDLASLVIVFQFPDSHSATTFYSDSNRLNKFQPALSGVFALSARGPAAQPSRWLQVRSCVARAESTAPAAPPVGAPAAVPSRLDTCPKGLSSTSIAIASITRRGDEVVFVQADGYYFSLDGNGLRGAAVLSDVANNTALTEATLTLVRAQDAT